MGGVVVRHDVKDVRLRPVCGESRSAGSKDSKKFAPVVGEHRIYMLPPGMITHHLQFRAVADFGQPLVACDRYQLQTN